MHSQIGLVLDTTIRKFKSDLVNAPKPRNRAHTNALEERYVETSLFTAIQQSACVRMCTCMRMYVYICACLCACMQLVALPSTWRLPGISKMNYPSQFYSSSQTQLPVPNRPIDFSNACRGKIYSKLSKFIFFYLDLNRFRTSDDEWFNPRAMNSLSKFIKITSVPSTYTVQIILTPVSRRCPLFQIEFKNQQN